MKKITNKDATAIGIATGFLLAIAQKIGPCVWGFTVALVTLDPGAWALVALVLFFPAIGLVVWLVYWSFAHTIDLLFGEDEKKEQPCEK